MELKCVLLIISAVVPSLVFGSSDLEKRFDELAKETAELSRRLTDLEVKNEALEGSVEALKVENRELDERVQHSEVEIEQLKSVKATLEERVEYLEAITRKNVPRTCEDLKLLGVSKSGSYLIDPDGAGLGEAPITVMCDMDSSSNGITLVPHNLVGVLTEVEHCPDPGCHRTEIRYDAPMRQMRALMELSSECSQEIQYDCFIAPLVENDDNMAWWNGAVGQANYYRDGSHAPAEHTCACDQDGSCVNERYSCNCDSSAPEWLSDNGNLTNMTALPVTEVSFGGLIYDAQLANFGIGHLTCQGRKEFIATESCETLRMSGQVTSGYYFVDGPGGIHHDLVFCDMELESTDANFQVDTAVRLPEYPVAFDAYNPVNYQTTDAAVLTWGATYSNEGNAFDPATGTFTAPFPGVYKFTLVVDEEGNTRDVLVYIRKNGSGVARVRENNKGSNEDEGTGSASVILVLSEGDTVDVYMSSENDIIDAGYTSQFMGHLLFLLP